MRYLKHFFSIFLCVSMISCLGIETPVEETIQFTSDDLSYFYYDSDTLVFDGNPIEYVDTVSFIYNGSDTIKIPVKTRILPNYDLFSPDGLAPGIQGESDLRFINVKGFRYLNVYIIRTSNIIKGINYSSYRKFYVGVNEFDIYSKRVFMSDSIHLDTASVLGVHYNDVLKLTPDASTKAVFKTLYFAKNFGYIKIETLDGNRLERLLP